MQISWVQSVFFHFIKKSTCSLTNVWKMTSFTRPNIISHIRHEDLLPPLRCWPKQQGIVWVHDSFVCQQAAILPSSHLAAELVGEYRGSLKTNGSNEFDCVKSAVVGVFTWRQDAQMEVWFIYWGPPKVFHRLRVCSHRPAQTSSLFSWTSALLFCCNDANYD